MSEKRNKWTPGPWRVEEGTTVIWTDNSYDAGTNCVGCIVARAAQPPSFKASRPTGDEQVANTILIAAAPDMFEALHDLLTRPTDGAARERARAALAKARGE